MQHAEQLIEAQFCSQELNRTDASWKRRPATEQQLAMIRRLLRELGAEELAPLADSRGTASAMIGVLKLLQAHEAGHLTFPRF